MNITLIPAFSDNYIFLGELENGSAFVVDPGDAKPVIDFLEAHNLTLDAILITHHHADHTGGLISLKETYGCDVYGPRNDQHRISGLDILVGEDDCVTFHSLTFTVSETPGHTTGHICYIENDKKLLFCGDTLFSLGCGRLFEGTPEQMFASLHTFKSLPDEMRVYCAHEYTLSNLAFAKAYIKERDYSEIEMALKDLRAKEKPTVPSTIGFEKRWNPFMRCQNVAEFADMRAAKDNF